LRKKVEVETSKSERYSIELEELRKKVKALREEVSKKTQQCNALGPWLTYVVETVWNVLKPRPILGQPVETHLRRP